MTDSFSEKGTELDHICITVFQCAMQLINAVNKNLKHQYVVISAKSVHFSSEIIRAIEIMEKTIQNSNTSSANLTKLSDGAVFPNSAVRIKVAEKCKLINTETSKQLMLATRIAVGVWPPPGAISDMVNAAILLATSCKYLCDLVGILGYFPLLDTPLDLNMVDFDENETPDLVIRTSTNKTSTSSKTRLADLSYAEYNRETQLKKIQEMSSDNAGSTMFENEPVVIRDEPYEKFLVTLDTLLNQLVVSVSDVKRVHSLHLNEEFVSATSTVAACTEAVLTEIQSYEPFSENADSTLVMEAEDFAAITEKLPSFTLNEDEIPIPYKSVLETHSFRVQSRSKRCLRGSVPTHPDSWQTPQLLAAQLAGIGKSGVA